MPDKPKTIGKAKRDQGPEPSKRLNRAVGVSEALSGVLDAAFKKRGFATRDILTNWPAIAPKPYDTLAIPAELRWPRGAGHEGATLYLRAAPGQAMAIAHEASRITQAVNRYFGYLLVREIRLSAEPFASNAGSKVAPVDDSGADARAKETVRDVPDDRLREALANLGAAVIRTGRRTRQQR